MNRDEASARIIAHLEPNFRVILAKKALFSLRNIFKNVGLDKVMEI